ncbi:MICOS complex subunit MIC27 [Hyperolius riggenbachi]|uniref:MICOS complex subunit MIC27 n=1 Tax=Hyperolius riggenbachi TaxID=752182 RepID=UPI0035A382F2
MVAKIFKLASLPAGLALTSYGLYAVSDRQPKGSGLSPNKLSVYLPPPRESRFIEEQPGRVQNAFTAARTTLSPAVTWSTNTVVAIWNGVEESIQFGKDSYVYLKDPPPEFLPRLGVITFSWLTGLFLARRGSRLKKIAYPVGLTALGVSLCYPTQAVIVAKVTGRKLYNGSHWTYDSIRSLWTQKPEKKESLSPPAGDSKGQKQPEPETVPEKKEEEPETVPERKEEEPETASESKAEEPDTVPDSKTEEPITREETEAPASPDLVPPSHIVDDSTEEASPEAVQASKFTPPPNLSDHGQSNPEDVDMYSTRS